MLFSNPEYRNHQEIRFVRDETSGLRAILALHTDRPGYGGGGTRMMAYSDDGAALDDALRLSYAMSLKFALAGVRKGGGKSVILGNPATDKSEALLLAFGRAVEQFGGRFTASTDVGLSPEDLNVVGRETDHVRGLPNLSGPTSAPTAWGVFQAIRAAVETHLRQDSLNGLSVAVQGIGAVGYGLCAHLHDAGVRLIVADVDPENTARAASAFGATVVPLNGIISADADILAPCAIGGVLTSATIPTIRAGIVCGAANNQLDRQTSAALLAARGILYVPDFLVNAGGAINVSHEKNYNRDRAFADVALIYDRCLELFERSRLSGRVPADEALVMAEEAIRAW